MQLLKQSSTAHPLVFFMADSTDHVTGKTGLTPTVKIGKNGGTGASPTGAVSEIDATNQPGFYKVEGNATDTNTTGVIALYATATGADPGTQGFLVVAFDPDAVAVGAATQTQVTGGPYALNSASFAFNAALPFTTAQLAQTLKANLVQWLGGTPSALNAGLVQSDVELVAGSDVAGALRDLSYDYSTGTLPISIGNDIQGRVLGGGSSAFAGPGANVNVTSISDEGTGNLFLLLNDYAGGQLNADLTGKVLGGGASAFAGNGAQVSVSGVATSSELAKLVSTLQLVSGSTYRFTASALLNAPSSSGTGISGPSPVTLTYVDSNGDPVPLVEFSVVGQGVQRALVDGTASFGLNDGTYTVVSGPVGGVMFPDTALTVSGSGAATIVGYTVNIVPPSDPTLCVVYGFAVKNDGSKAANVPITFIVSANIPAKTAGGRIIAYVPVNETTDANGFFQATLIRDKAYQINSPTLRFNGTVFTPTGSSYDLSTAIT